jgi:hypothetical protein
MKRDDWDVYWVSEEYRETAEGMLRDIEKSEHLLRGKDDVEFEGFVLEHTTGKTTEVKASVTPRRSRARNPWLEERE